MSVEAKIRALWRQVPQVNCKGLCHESCTTIEMSRTERAMLERSAGRKQKTMPDGSCSLLEGGRCSAYGNRPMLCRLFGAVPEMPCRYGCAPTMTSEQGRRLMHEADRIGGSISKARRLELLEMLAKELSAAAPVARPGEEPHA